MCSLEASSFFLLSFDVLMKEITSDMKLLTAVNKLTRSCTLVIEGSTDSTRKQVTLCTSTCCVSNVQTYTHKNVAGRIAHCVRR
jgi:hypothetical protein